MGTCTTNLNFSDQLDPAVTCPHILRNLAKNRVFTYLQANSNLLMPQMSDSSRKIKIEGMLWVICFYLIHIWALLLEQKN